MKLHNKLAKFFGYELIKRKKHPTAEIHLSNLIDHLNIDVVLDVGANEGQFVRRLRSQGFNGEVHSFEPVTATFEKLRAASEGDGRWHVHQLALSDKPGEAEINITASSDLASFLQPNEFGVAKYSQIKVSATEIVRVGTVNDFIATHLGGSRDRKILLKMDTQGHDLQVFRGASNVLGSIAAMLSELSIKPIYEGMPHYLDVLREYEDAGFSLTGMYPISRAADLTLVEMDCMLINTGA